MVWVTPGTSYDPDDHLALDQEGYLKSRNHVTDNYQLERDAWLEQWSTDATIASSLANAPETKIPILGTPETRAALRKMMNDNIKDRTGTAYVAASQALAAMLTAAENGVRARYRDAQVYVNGQIMEGVDVDWRVAQDEAELLVEEMNDSQPTVPSRTHRAMAKLCMWPNIRRFKPGGPDDEKNNLPLSAMDGFRIQEMTKAVVSDYYGVTGMVARSKRQTLEDFVKEKERRFGKVAGELGYFPGFMGAATVGMAGLAYLDPLFRERLVERVVVGLGLGLAPVVRTQVLDPILRNQVVDRVLGWVS